MIAPCTHHETHQGVTSETLPFGRQVSSTYRFQELRRCRRQGSVFEVVAGRVPEQAVPVAAAPGEVTRVAGLGTASCSRVHHPRMDAEGGDLLVAVESWAAHRLHRELALFRVVLQAVRHVPSKNRHVVQYRLEIPCPAPDLSVQSPTQSLRKSATQSLSPDLSIRQPATQSPPGRPASQPASQ